MSLSVKNIFYLFLLFRTFVMSYVFFVLRYIYYVSDY
nr:MAG TPA: hypothetical protein [Caudoviricetes sp.]